MKKYRLSAEVTISLSTIVAASTEQEALDIARGRELAQITDYGEQSRVWVTSGELDGTPMDITVEQACEE